MKFYTAKSMKNLKKCLYMMNTEPIDGAISP